MDEQGGGTSSAGDAFKRADYNNDYLAERSERTPSPCRITNVLVIWTFKPDHQTLGACHASRIVDGGVDSQA